VARPVPSTDLSEAASQLRAVLAPLMRRLSSRRLDGELTPAQVSVLSLLDHGGAVTPARLASKEQVMPQSMATTLAQLFRRGLISRAADPLDGRCVLVSITPAGEEVLNEERRERVRYLERAMSAAYTDEELAELVRLVPLLERLIPLV
jgi:DNA-binding MarR family transcriptional regulator